MRQSVEEEADTLGYKQGGECAQVVEEEVEAKAEVDAPRRWKRRQTCLGSRGGVNVSIKHQNSVRFT